jgi:RNA polymerase sigma factor (sigma-70 family)
MKGHEPLARRSTELLLAVAGGDTTSARDYDALLFALLVDVARRRGRFMAAEAMARAGFAESGGSVVVAAGTDLDEAAVVAAEIALTRARASALRFDPTRSDGASWALGCLGHAYRDALRDLGRTRRMLVEVPADEETLDALSGPSRDDPELAALEQDLLMRALAVLSEDERFVLIAQVHYGLAYREIAQIRFGDEGAAKKVDRLLQSAKRKLQEAYQQELEDE